MKITVDKYSMLGALASFCVIFISFSYTEISKEVNQIHKQEAMEFSQKGYPAQAETNAQKQLIEDMQKQIQNQMAKESLAKGAYAASLASRTAALLSFEKFYASCLRNHCTQQQMGKEIALLDQRMGLSDQAPFSLRSPKIVLQHSPNTQDAPAQNAPNVVSQAAEAKKIAALYQHALSAFSAGYQQGQSLSR